MSTDNKRKAPAFQFYADDFLAGTSDMSAEEVGAYIRLLCHQWTKGGIPNDEDRAGRMAGLMGSPSLGYVLAKFSPCDDGMLRNERLEQVRREQAEFRVKQSTSGKSGAQKRWAKWQKDSDPNSNPNGSAMATPMATPMANSWPDDSSPSPSPKEDTKAPKSPRQRFQKPTVQDIEAQCTIIELPHNEATKFFNYYESKGWMVGKNQMKCWKAALAGWKQRRDENQQSFPTEPSTGKRILRVEDSF